MKFQKNYSGFAEVENNKRFIECKKFVWFFQRIINDTPRNSKKFWIYLEIKVKNTKQVLLIFEKFQNYSLIYDISNNKCRCLKMFLKTWDGTTDHRSQCLFAFSKPNIVFYSSKMFLTSHYMNKIQTF